MSQSLTENYATTGGLLRDLKAMVDTPSRKLPSEVADQSLVLAEGMRFNSKITPYMIEPMNLVSDRTIRTVIFVSSARGGKTLSLMDAVQCWIILCRPSDNLTVFATEAMARRYSRMRFGKQVKGSPDLRAMMTEDRFDDNVLNKSFKTGMSSWLGSPTPVNLSASDYRYTFWSDVDRGDISNSDGDILTQLQKRTQTFGSSGKTFAEASPSRDILDPNWKKSSPHEAPPVEGVLGFYNDGDRRMYYWLCPHCETRIQMTPDLELFQLPNSRDLLEEINNSGADAVSRKYNKIYCPHCAAQIDESHKKKLNATGVWIKENPDNHNSTASFWLSGLCAAFQSWQDILAKYFKALVYYQETGDESKLKAVMNVDLGAPYRPESINDSLTAEELQSRADDELEKRQVPEGGRFLIASIDVQKRKFVVQVESFGVNETRCLVDRFDLIFSEARVYGGNKQGIEPATYEDDWDTLVNNVIKKTYPLEGDPSRVMRVHLTVCDSGGSASSTGDGSVTELAYKFWRKCSKDSELKGRFELVKGIRPTASNNAPAIKMSVMTKQSKTAREAKVVGKLQLWLINTTLLKDTMYAKLKKTEGDGQIFFPSWLPTWFFKELTAETRDEKGWNNIRARRNEAFDLICYTHAGFLILVDRYFSGKIDWNAPPLWAEDWDSNNSNILSVTDSGLVDKPQLTKQPRARMKR